MGEFFTRIALEPGQEAVVTDFVIEALGYELYEAGSVTVRGGEVTSLGTILLTPEDEESVRLPGHTPFFPEEGAGGFSGFVCDAVTKQRIPFFTMSATFEGDYYEFSFEYPPRNENIFAKLEGEFILWAATDSQTIAENLVFSADGYEPASLAYVDIFHRQVTDVGVIYLNPIGSQTPNPQPSPPTPPSPVPKPVKPDPGSDVINIPGHTPFYPEDGIGGFAGFVFDAVTKKPVSSFSLENITWLDGTKGESQTFYWPYESDLIAQIEGEFIIWVGMTEANPKTDTMSAFDIVADGYESYRVSPFTVEERSVTDLGVIYLNPKGAGKPPPLDTGQISVMLEWGAKPADLDLHATAPLSEGSKRFHIFAYETHLSYGNASDPDALMTSDSESAYGSESIVIFKPQPGVPYTFYVHDFTNVAKKSGAWDLANSGAVVSIYIGESAPTTLKVPNKEGTLWEVCTIVDGKITPSEAVSYEGRPLNIGA